MRILCFFFFFSFSLVTLSSYTPVLWPFIYDIHCIYFHIYMMMYVVFHLSLYVLFLFSLYTHVSLCMQSLFLFHTKMPWWILFKVFQKDKLWKSMMPWTLFLQKFSKVCVRIKFSYNSTSVYEFSDLRLLSWFICLLWFYHGLPKGEFVRTYVESVRNICDVNWLIFWQNAFYLYLGRSKMDLVLQGTRVQV